MRGIERFFAALFLAGAVAGAAAFSYRAGQTPETAVAPLQLTQPASHGASSLVIHVPELPAPPRAIVGPVTHVILNVRRPHPVPVPVPVPVLALGPVTRPKPQAAAPSAPVDHTTDVPRAAPEPAAPATPAAPVAAPVPTPAPVPTVRAPAADVPVLQPASPTWARKHGHGKSKRQDVQPPSPLAETLAPVEPPPTGGAEQLPVLAVAGGDDSDHGHGNGHGHGKDK